MCLGTRELGRWLREAAFTPLKGVPRYLVPKYFDEILTGVYLALLKRSWSVAFILFLLFDKNE